MVDVLWLVVGVGGHILAGGGWWWMIVGGGGYILDGGGWWSMVMDGGGSWHSFV